MAFGMGTCCTQLTLDATDLVESLHIFDHMAVLSPLMIAASAGSPIYQGKLVNTDTRWKALSDLVDDRSTNEVFTGIRSRYSSVYGYLGEGFENYQDVAYPVDESSYKYLIQQGVSDSLAKYAANIILKDPMIIEKDYHSRKVNLFQSHQSTVWQNVRWKACQQGDSSQYSYRVEFRPLEVQVGDMENACFIIFVVVYIKARLYAGRDTRISISKLDENMAVCHLQGAIKNQVYWWNHTGNESTQMAPSDIWNNDIYPMIQDYLSSPSFSQNEGVTQEEVLHMVQHVGSIFTGKTPTRAEKTRQWISARNPLVKDNSISNQVLTELLWNQTQEGILT
jgi:glutamate--cysteine ligase catalytic subunit